MLGIICSTAAGQQRLHFSSRNLVGPDLRPDSIGKPVFFDPNSFDVADYGYRNFWYPVIDGLGTVTSNCVTIENSLPKGGGLYTDATGHDYRYTIFVIRVINGTADSLSLSMFVPATPIELASTFSQITAASPVSNSFTLFLPFDTVTLDKLALYGYGVTDLEPYIPTSVNTGTRIERTVSPGKDLLFYLGILWFPGSPVKREFHNTRHVPVRSSFHIDKEILFYSMRGVSPQLDSAVIPLGRVVVKK